MNYAVLQATALAANGAITVGASAVITVRDPSGTLVNLFSSRTGGSVGNPVTADANGFFRVYVAPGRYDITVVTDSGTVTYEDVAAIDSGDPDELKDALKLQVNGLAALRGLTIVSGERIWLSYHTSEGDGGHGVFRGITGAAPATYTDDNGITILPTAGNGSTAWVREFSGAVNVQWFGATTSDIAGAVNRAAIQSALDTGSVVFFPELYVVNGNLNYYSGQRIYSDSITAFGAGVIFKVTSTANIDLFRPAAGSSSQDLDMYGLTLKIDAASTFTRGTTVRMFYGTGRRTRIEKCWFYNLARAEEQQIVSLTSSGTTATLEKAAHGLIVGNWLRIGGVSDPDAAPGDAPYNGTFQVATVPDADHITYVMSGTPTNSTASLSAYKAAYISETAGKSIAIFRGIEFDYTIPTFESVIDGNIFNGFDSDLTYFGHSSLSAGAGLMVYHLITRNNFNSVAVDFANNAANLRLSDAAQCMVHDNTFNSPSCNIVLESDNAADGSDYTQISGNYWEGGNSGRARIILRDNSSYTTIREAAIDEQNIRNHSTGPYWFEGFNGAHISNAAIISHTTGEYTFSNDVNMGDGKGLDFSAFTDGSIAGAVTGSVFKDYEEGTWTPSLGGSATYTSRGGYYTKVGRKVHVTGNVVVATIGTGSATVISGLPYTSANINIQPGEVSYFSGIATSVVALWPSIGGAESVITFNSLTVAGTSQGSSAIFQDGTRVDFALEYIV